MMTCPTKLFYCVVVFFGISFSLSAQNFDISSDPMRLISAARKTADTRAAGTFSVDPEIYLLGPGDAFEIRSSKMPWVQYYGTVNETGVLYIPEFGTFNVDRKSLTTAKASIANLILKQNPTGDEIDIILSSPKQVEVVVTGEGVKSGSYRLSGTLRVLDAIKIALRDSVSIYRDINFRNVNVTIQDNSFNLDLAAFIANGKGIENPYLYPGAIITLSPPTQWVTVSGAVSSAFPEIIPLRAGEIYKDIFTLYKFADDADTANILVYRKGSSPKKYSVSSIANVAVENSDYVIVGSLISRRQPAYVLVRGEIRNPGAYPLESGVKVARGVVAMAGGITERGDSNRIYIIRKDPLATVAGRLGKAPGSSPKSEQLTPSMILSGDYRIIPLRGSSNEILENGDEIVVPEISNTVHLSGFVNKPGAYPYAGGDKPIDYYVGLAGGWKKKADKKHSSIVTAYGDHWIVKTTPVEAGDIIFVPEKSEDQALRTVDLAIRSLYYVSLAITTFFTIRQQFKLMNDEE